MRVSEVYIRQSNDLLPLTSHPGVRRARAIRVREERENDECAHGGTARVSLLIYVMTTIKLTTSRRSGEQEEDIKY